MRPESAVPAQLRRRRRAAYRCPPLANGRRDPLLAPRKVQVVTVRVLGGRTVEFTGCDQAVLRAIKAVGDIGPDGARRSMRAPTGRAWHVRNDLADDVLAYLEARSFRIEAAL